MRQPETTPFLHRRTRQTGSAVQNHRTYAWDSGGNAFPSPEKAAMSLQTPRSRGRLALAVVTLFIAALGVFTAPGFAPSAQAAVTSWQQLPGSARDVGAGANGSLWAIGTNPVFGG